MILETGEKLGPYEIVSQLGKGAMGVVYRARDTRLGRDVAVKVLAASIAGDADGTRRFEVEARAAGVLSHPNIVAIHDIGTHSTGPYLVSELLEGETLRDLLRAGKTLPVRKAVEYGLQIALGLAAAHEKGIVHRDLKPENLFVTRDARVKILDFGLARLVDPIGAPAHSESTIRALQLGGQTQPGTVLGTVGYMSPEQVRGQPADHRSDIFSFGTILYEMLAGKKAFQGESGVDVLSAILSDEPPPLPREVPASIDRVVRRCLRKPAEERFQSARDLAFQLETLSATPPTLVTAALSEPSRATRAVVIGSIVAALALSAGAWALGRKLATRGPAVFRQLTFRRGTVTSARFAADGKSVLYSASWQGVKPQLFHADPASPESRALDLPAGDLLSLSAKGEMAMLLAPHLVDGEPAGTLARAGSSGGTPREILPDVEAADFSPDGEALAIVRRVAGRSRLEFPQGKVVLESDGAIGDLRVSPDGKSLAFVEHARRGDAQGVVALFDGTHRTLTPVWDQIHGLAWKGSEIWFTAADASGSALRAVSNSGVQRLITRVTGRLTLHDLSPSGQVLLSRESARGGLVVGQRDLSWFDGSALTDLARDGSAVLFVESGGEAAQHALYLRGTEGSAAVRLGEGVSGKLSPDGKSALVIPAGGPPRLLLMPTGAGESIALPLGEVSPVWAGWAPDGKGILVEGGRPNRLYLREVEGAALRPVGSMAVALAPAAISNDGAQVAALDATGHLALISTADGTARTLGADLVPILFSANFLYAFRQGDLPAQVLRIDLQSGRSEAVTELSPADPAGVAGIGSVLATADAKTFAYGYRRVLSDLYLVDGLR